MFKRLFFIFLIISILTISVFADSPVIISQPQNVYLPNNVQFPYRVNFSILASGDDISYKWQYSYTDGRTWNNFNPDQTSSTLSRQITSDSVNGGWIFRCVVSNSNGQVVSNVVSVSVGAYILDSIPQLLSWCSEVANSIFNWSGQCCTVIISEPLLLFTIGFLAIGLTIAIFSRLLSRS